MRVERPTPSVNLRRIATGLPRQIVADRDPIEPHCRHRLQRVLGAFDDRFAVAVEGSVEQDGNAGQFAETRDQPVVQRIDVSVDGLYTYGSVDVNDAGNLLVREGERTHGLQHVRTLTAHLEEFAGVLQEYARRVGSEPLTAFDFTVEALFGGQGSRITEDAAVSERARTELGAALDPAENAALRDQLRNVARDVVAFS